jgi:hypothetical protein
MYSENLCYSCFYEEEIKEKEKPEPGAAEKSAGQLKLF